MATLSDCEGLDKEDLKYGVARLQPRGCSDG